MKPRTPFVVTVCAALLLGAVMVVASEGSKAAPAGEAATLILVDGAIEQLPAALAARPAGEPPQLYGDGRASERVLEALLREFDG